MNSFWMSGGRPILYNDIRVVPMEVDNVSFGPPMLQSVAEVYLN
jgi:hypothetical protein